MLTLDTTRLNIDQSNGRFGRGHITFTYTFASPEEAAAFTRDHAGELSIKGGYHPAGYGPLHNCVKNTHRATWRTFASCD